MSSKSGLEWLISWYRFCDREPTNLFSFYLYFSFFVSFFLSIFLSFFSIHPLFLSFLPIFVVYVFHGDFMQTYLKYSLQTVGTRTISTGGSTRVVQLKPPPPQVQSRVTAATPTIPSPVPSILTSQVCIVYSL